MSESPHTWGWVSDPARFFFRERATRWTPEDKELLRRLFLTDRLPIASIAQTLGRTPASINTVLSTFGIPRQRWLRRYRAPETMTPALARIHAHVCGDGHLYVKRERDDYGPLKEYKRGKYRKRYGFGYTNLNPALIRSFSEDVETVLGLKTRYDAKKWTTYVKSRDAWELMRGLGTGKSREWRISDRILQGDASVKAAWLKAFFDDEAHFVPNAGIRVRSVNRPGLEQAAQMLRQFVPCHLTPAVGLYLDTSCYLAVPKSARKRFFELIGSTKCRG